LKRDGKLRVYVTSQAKEKLGSLAKAEDRTLSTYVSRVIEAHLDGSPLIESSEQSAADGAGYTYFIKSSGYYKVGRAKNVERRLAAMCLPEKPVVVCAVLCPDYGNLEMALHVLLANKRVNGEWFALSDADVAAVRHLMESRASTGDSVVLLRA
jgi:hypothetical protein